MKLRRRKIRSASELRRDEFRMAYPAHHQTCEKWGEAIWTAPDLLLASSDSLRLARNLSNLNLARAFQ